MPPTPTEDPPRDAAEATFNTQEAENFLALLREIEEVFSEIIRLVGREKKLKKEGTDVARAELKAVEAHRRNQIKIVRSLADKADLGIRSLGITEQEAGALTDQTIKRARILAQQKKFNSLLKNKLGWVRDITIAWHGVANVGRRVLRGLNRILGVTRAIARQTEEIELTEMMRLGGFDEATIESVNRFVVAMTLATDQTEDTVRELARMGIQAGATGRDLENLIKAAIGLTRGGVNARTAITGLIAAQQGHYTQLQRYIPALRDVQNEQEAWNLIMDTAKRGFDANVEAGNSLSRSWSDLKTKLAEFAIAILDSLPILDALEWTVNKLYDASRTVAIGMGVFAGVTIGLVVPALKKATVAAWAYATALWAAAIAKAKLTFGISALVGGLVGGAGAIYAIKKVTDELEKLQERAAEGIDDIDMDARIDAQRQFVGLAEAWKRLSADPNLALSRDRNEILKDIRKYINGILVRSELTADIWDDQAERAKRRGGI